MPAGRDDFQWLDFVFGGEDVDSRPFRGGLGRGFFELESNHADQEYCHWSTRHQRKTSTRPLCPAYGGDISPFSKSENGESRREMTPAEKLLWQEVRAKKLEIEVDGDIYDLQKEEDERREKALTEMGLRVVRFGNDEVVRELSAVVGKIKSLISI